MTAHLETPDGKVRDRPHLDMTFQVARVWAKGWGPTTVLAVLVYVLLGVTHLLPRPATAIVLTSLVIVWAVWLARQKRYYGLFVLLAVPLNLLVGVTIIEIAGRSPVVDNASKLLWLSLGLLAFLSLMAHELQKSLSIVLIGGVIIFLMYLIIAGVTIYIAGSIVQEGGPTWDQFDTSFFVSTGAVRGTVSSILLFLMAAVPLGRAALRAKDRWENNPSFDPHQDVLPKDVVRRTSLTAAALFVMAALTLPRHHLVGPKHTVVWGVFGDHPLSTIAIVLILVRSLFYHSSRCS